MSNIKLTYFGLAGRAEAIRMCFHIGKIPFEDNRLTKEQFGKLKPDLPLGQVPILEVDGKVYCQSNAILHYAGTRSGFYPKDPLEAMRCDQAIETMSDILTKIPKNPGDEVKYQMDRSAFFAAGGFGHKALSFLETAVKENGNLATKELTIADLMFVNSYRLLICGLYDHVSKDLLDAFPLLKKLVDRVENDPRIVDFYTKFPKLFNPFEKA
eukprot:Platyproteum_vivax@DN4286_c0_g1_i2.p1